MSFLLGLYTQAFGQFDPPAGYYNTATGTGATLKSQLHDIIDGHTVFSYGAARSILQVTDQDPNDSDRMLLVYNRVSLDVSSINPGGSIPGWDSGNSWNREHTWPRSLGVDSSGADNSDLHQLRPSNPTVNSQRGNLAFGGEFGAQGFGSVFDSGSFYYPGDEDAAMIARQQFYMAVRYDGSDSNTTDLELNVAGIGNSSGKLGRLVEWHYETAPDFFELRRNDVIYDDYQGNRNPFVDRPELVWSVFVDQQNDAQLSIDGASVGADGFSAMPYDLGRVYVGGAAPVSQAVTINKAGQDGTYFMVSSSGDATSNAEGERLPMATGGADSHEVMVSLDVTSATSGAYSGTITVDNLDVTTQGGVGRGSNDANDLIIPIYTVLDHPVASFSAGTVETSAIVDLGSISQGSSAVDLPLEIFNYDGAGSPSFASDLDVDLIGGTGDTSILAIDLAPSSGLAQGGSVTFDAMLNPASVGEFSATYNITLSGEDLPGEQQQMLTLTLQGEVAAAPLPGDYNADGLVDAADYSVWRDTFGSTEDLAADGDNSGEIDAGDYTVWENQYNTGAAASRAVPEPGALLLVSLPLLAATGRRKAR